MRNIESGTLAQPLPAPNRPEMVRCLERLVSCPTPMPPGDGYRTFADVLKSEFFDLPGQWRRIDVPEALWSGEDVRGERVNLIFVPNIRGGEAMPEAIIYFHTDTAPAGEGWSVPPFAVTEQDGRLYGRGSADMKGTIVAVRDALLRLLRLDQPLAYQPVLAFCTDEEGGRYPGIRYLAETEKLPEILLNLNGSAEPRIWAGCLGSLDFSVTVLGRACHSGEPERGLNATEPLAALLSSINVLKADIEVRITDMPAPPWADGPLRARLNVTAIHAGDKGSAIPGSCRLVLNRRYLPEENETSIIAEVRDMLADTLASLPQFGWAFEVVGHLPPVTDPAGPATARWVRARAKGFGLPETAFQRYGSGTSSDFGWVQRAGLQHMLLGGLSRPDRNIHGPDEFTTVDDLAALSNSIFWFLARDPEENTSVATPMPAQTGTMPEPGQPVQQKE